MPQPTTADPMDMFRQRFDGSRARRDHMKTQMQDLTRALHRVEAAAAPSSTAARETAAPATKARHARHCEAA